MTMTTDKTSPTAGKRKPAGYWKDPANVIAAAKAIVEEHGPKALTADWLKANGHGSLASAISEHGGITWLRAEVGIAAVATQTASTPLERRSLNLENLRQILHDLQDEGLGELIPSQLVILLQQGGYDKLPMSEGRDLFTAVTRGLLTPTALMEWGLGDAPNPPARPQRPRT